MGSPLQGNNDYDAGKLKWLTRSDRRAVAVPGIFVTINNNNFKR